MEMEIGPESNEASAVWNEFGLGSLLGDDLDDGDYGPASLSAVDQQQHRRNDALQSVLRRVGPSPEKKRKMQLPYMKAMMGRYGTLPAERKIVNSRVINRLADKYANLDMLSALTPRAQARRREQAARDIEKARRDRDKRLQEDRDKQRNPMGLKRVGRGARQAESSLSPQRRSRSATGLGVSSSAKVLPRKRDARTGGSGSKKGAKAAWGSSSASASTSQLPPRSPLHDPAASEDNDGGAQARGRARRAASEDRRSSGGGAGRGQKPQWSSVSPERRGGRQRHGPSGDSPDGGGGGGGKDDSIDSLDAKIVATYNRVSNRSREQAEHITKSLLGEVSSGMGGGPAPPAPAVAAMDGGGGDGDGDGMAMSDWEMKSRLAKDRARRRRREKKERMLYGNGTSASADAAAGRFEDEEDQQEGGGGAFALTALSGQVAESLEPNRLYDDDDELDGLDDCAEEVDSIGLSPGGRIEIASVQPMLDGRAYVAPKALAPIGNPFAGGAAAEGGLRLRQRQPRQVRPMGGSGAGAGAAAAAASMRARRDRLSGFEGGARRGRRGSRDAGRLRASGRGRSTDKRITSRGGDGGGGGGGATTLEEGGGEQRWLGDVPLKRMSFEAAKEQRARERARERAEKREARMLGKRNSRHERTTAVDRAGRLMKPDRQEAKKWRRRKEQYGVGDESAGEGGGGSGRGRQSGRDPLNNDERGRRRRSSSRPREGARGGGGRGGGKPGAAAAVPHWEKNASSAAERRERGEKALAEKKAAQKAAQKKTLAEESRSNGNLPEGGGSKQGQRRHSVGGGGKAKKKENDFEVIEREFRASEVESRAAIDETAAFLARLREKEAAKKEEDDRAAGVVEAPTHDDDTSVDLLNALHAAAVFGEKRAELELDVVEDVEGGSSSSREPLRDVGDQGGGGGFFLTQGGGFDGDGGNDEVETTTFATTAAAEAVDEHDGENRQPQNSSSAIKHHHHQEGVEGTPAKHKKEKERFARHQDQLNQLQQRFAKSSAAAHMMFRMAAEDDAIGEIVATATSPKKEITSR